MEVMLTTYRTHGSPYEARVPMFIFKSVKASPSNYFDMNYKLAA